MTNQQIEKLTNQFETPLYVFDISVLKARVAALRNALPQGVNLCFAVKAIRLSFASSSKLSTAWNFARPAKRKSVKDFPSPHKKW